VKEKAELSAHRTIANRTVFELVTGFRRETGNQFRLLCILTAGMIVPVLLVLLAITTKNAASNLESRRYITAFTADSPAPAVATLKASLIKHYQIDTVTVLPATESVPIIVEIQPIASLTTDQTESLARELENSGEFNLVLVNLHLLKRNTSAYLKAQKLSLIFFLMALALAASTCMIVVKREILRSNSASINLQRQLGASPTAISKPFIARAALMTLMAIIGAAGLVTVFYKTAKHLVDVSSYSMVLMDALPVVHLILLTTVSITAACYAATNALQSTFIFTNQLLNKIKPKQLLTNQPIST